MRTNLSVVSNDASHAERASSLQAQARDAAAEHVALTLSTMDALVQQASQIADGGDAYPVGLRGMFKQIATEVRSRSLSVDALMERAR